MCVIRSKGKEWWGVLDMFHLMQSPELLLLSLARFLLSVAAPQIFSHVSHVMYLCQWSSVFLHDWLISVVQIHRDASWESARAQLWCGLYWGKGEAVLSHAKTILPYVFILVLKWNFKIWSTVSFIRFLIPNSRQKDEVWDLENLRIALCPSLETLFKFR